MKKDILVNAIGGIIATAMTALATMLIQSKIAIKPLQIPLWVIVAILTWTTFTTLKAIKLKNLIGNVKHAKIAIISYSFSSSFFFDDLLRELIDTCNTNNLNLELKLPVNDFNNSDFKRLLKKTLDEEDEFSSAIILSSNVEDNLDSLKDFEKKFKKPIVLLDVGSSAAALHFTDLVSIIGFSNKVGGQKAAEIAQHILDKNESSSRNILVIASELQQERQEVFEKELSKRNKDLKITINDKGNFNRKTARKIAYSYLTKNADTSIIFCTNDEMALGVLDMMELRR